MATLTPEAKQLLSTTIRSLRDRLLLDIHDEADRRYRLSVPITKAGLDEAHRRRRERLDGWLDEQVRAAKPKKKDEPTTRERLLRQAEKEAAATASSKAPCLNNGSVVTASPPPTPRGSVRPSRTLRDGPCA